MNLKQSLVAVGVAALMSMTTGSVMAQNNGGGGGFGGRRGNFDPAQFQQRMMERIREQMGVTNDAEWNVIETRVQKVMDARREVGGPGGFGRMFRGRRGPGGPGGPGNANNNNGGGRRRGFFGQPNPTLDALEKTIESNAPAEQLKAAMERYRADRKAKEATLEKAQQDLKKVLTVKQEAVALTMGLVN